MFQGSQIVLLKKTGIFFIKKKDAKMIINSENLIQHMFSFLITICKTSIASVYKYTRTAKLALLLLLLLAMLFIDALNAHAGGVYYIRSGATGNNSGSDWVNAYSSFTAAGLNNSSSTAPRGNTYYVADGSYGSIAFKNGASGSTRITVKKATTSAHGTETGWQSSYGDGQAAFSYINFDSQYFTFDGVSGGGPGNWQSGHGFKISSSQTSGVQEKKIDIKDASYLELFHTEIGYPSRDTNGDGDRILYCVGSADNVHIAYNYWYGDTDTLATVGYDFDNWVVEYSCFLQNYVATPGNHGGGWELTTGTGSSVIENFTFRYNYWIKQILARTGWFGFYDTGGGATDGIYIYGNVFYCPESHGCTNSGNGIIYSVSGTDGPQDNVKIYNNTFDGIDNPAYITLHHDDNNNSEFSNNIIYDIEAQPGIGTYIKSHNAIQSGYTVSGDSNLQTLSSDPLADPGNDDFSLNFATDAGYNTGGSVAGNDVDMFDNTRGADGTWYRGAIEYTGSNYKVPSPPSGEPSPPQNLRVLQ